MRAIFIPTFTAFLLISQALIHLYSAELLESWSDKAMKGKSERRLDLEEGVAGLVGDVQQ